jgi:hypothetical protein
MKPIYPHDASTSLDKLLTTVSRLMTHYARAPDERVATSIALCFERLAAVAAEDWPLLSCAGRHLSEAWRTPPVRAAAVSPEDAPDGCHRLTLAEGEHCRLTCCTECGAVFAHFGSFRLRLPQAAFHSICNTFVQAEKRLRLPNAHPQGSGAGRGERNRAVH